VAECFPGAQVTSAEGDSFSGTVKVKLGPIALVYGGSGTFVEKDDSAHRFVVDAKGKDKRGNGTAGAKVTLTMTAVSSGTEVEVLTDLAVTGKPAQFGRGVMQDVSDKLLGQFVACLEQRLGTDAADEAPVDATAERAPEPLPPDPAPVSTPDADAGSAPPPPPGPASPPEAGPGAAPPPASGPRPLPPPSGPAEAQRDDALDLGATVLPILLRTYWRQGLAAVVVIALVVWRRRSRR
jgi:carbon monoxide dehydrogenase subunit G